MRRPISLLLAAVMAGTLSLSSHAYASPSVGFSYVRTPLPYLADSPFAADGSAVYCPVEAHRPSPPAYDKVILPAEPDEDISDRFPDPVLRMYIVRRILQREAAEPYPIYGRDLDVIRRVTEADFSSSNVGEKDNGMPRILSMEGIHYFESLKTLACWWNHIEVLDVRGNPELETLSCFTNELRELYIGDNPNLTLIYCNNNRLRQLDVSGCPNLITLFADSNRLTRLDLHHNARLEYLGCSRNPLWYLDLRHLPALERLNASMCGLRTLDLSANRSLRELSVPANDLTQLDIGMLPDLTSLYCSGNWLRNLDVRGNRELTRLMASYNLLEAVDLSMNTQLYSVELHENSIASLDLRHLTELHFLQTDQETELSLPEVKGIVHHYGGAYERDRRRYPATRPDLA